MICFYRGEWQVSFRCDEDIFYEAMPTPVYNALLRIAQATFPQDQGLRGITPH